MNANRRYEALVLLDVNAGEEKIDEIVSRIEEMIKATDGGEIINLDRWGKKRLAYEINKKQFGYYVLYEFMAPTNFPAELNRFCRLESGVMRHLLLTIPDRVLKLKAQEEKIRAAMELRRSKAAEKGENGHVEDLLKDEGVAEVAAEVGAEDIAEKNVDPVTSEDNGAAEQA